MRIGAAKGAENAAFIAIGAGIAAALIIDGQIRSSHGFAGEIGHIRVGHSYQCVCGKVGCLEAVSSALAMKTSYKFKTGKEVSAKQILSLAGQGDVSAIAVWAEATLGLAQICLILTTLLAPEVIIFGGGVSQAGVALLDPVNKFLADEITFQNRPRLALAQFGAAAGIMGNAIAALDQLQLGRA